MNSRISNREKNKEGKKGRESKREKNTYQVYIYRERFIYIKRKREKELRKLEIKKTKERKTETYAVKTKV